jgi:hypothetical protein
MPPLPLQSIPVQTGANCGLFALLAAARLLGCDAEAEACLIAELDRLEKADPRTFIGEVLTVDLMLDLIRGVTANDTPLFAARAVAFSTPAELLAIIRDASQNGVALLLPFARPESYDRYYRLLGAQARGEATDAEVTAAGRVKESEANFHAADAHWALVNRLDESNGRVFLADSFEDVWGGGHGYEAEFTVEKLSAANLSLDGCFDWGNFLDEQGRAWGIHDIRGRAYPPSAPRFKNPARLDRILASGGQEALDLAGRLVLMERRRR